MLKNYSKFVFKSGTTMIDITKNKSFTEILKFLFKFLICQKILIFTNYLFKLMIKKKSNRENFFLKMHSSILYT
jgi:hypothetical protein